MKKFFLVFVLLLSLGFTSAHARAQSGQETIVFMRHGEKPLLENGQITCQGLNRALALPRVLLSKFARPNYIFAPHPYYGGLYYYVRGLINIEPTAVQLGMPINTQFYHHQVNDVARLLVSEDYRNAMVFVSWEHINLVFIVQKIMSMLGADPNTIPYWQANDFDSLYVLKINWDVNPPKIHFIHDSEGLNNQSNACPPVPTVPKIRQEVGRDVGTFIFVPNAEVSEKVSDTFSMLSCKGLNRSIALGKTLNVSYPSIDQFILLAPKKPGDQNYLNSLFTIEPALINKGYSALPAGFETIESVVAFLKTASFFNQTVVIAWPKADLANLVRAVYKDNGGNVDDVPNPVSDYDNIYEIKLSRDINGLKTKFKIVAENLNQVPSDCPK